MSSLILDQISMRFDLPNGDHVQALQDVSLDIKSGELMSVLGPSGCGKTTLGRSILRLVEPASGNIIYDGKDITHVKHEELRQLRKKMQIIFQDPYSSLNPRMTCEQIVGEGLLIHEEGDRVARQARVAELMEIVGLTPEQGRRYPHEFSGGQRQRISIARALLINPRILILDEATSALDSATETKLLQALDAVTKDRSTLVIAHRLATIRKADTILVMDHGTIVEAGSFDELYAQGGRFTQLVKEQFSDASGKFIS